MATFFVMNLLYLITTYCLKDPKSKFKKIYYKNKFACKIIHAVQDGFESQFSKSLLFLFSQQKHMQDKAKKYILKCFAKNMLWTFKNRDLNLVVR